MSVNDELPFGMYVSMPNFFEGDRSEVDDRLEWYATTTTIKDVIMSAQVRESVGTQTGPLPPDTQSFLTPAHRSPPPN